MIIIEHPDPRPNRLATAVGRAASEVGFLGHAVRRANWLMAARQGCIFEGRLSGGDYTARRIYHCVSANCSQLLVFAVIGPSTKYEKLVPTPGDVTISTDVGGGTADTITFHLEANLNTPTMFGDPGPQWSTWLAGVGIDNPGWQYLTITVDNLDVHHLMICEIPRGMLIEGTDTCIESVATDSYSGLQRGRYITDHTTAGLSDVLACIASGVDSTRRHLVQWVADDTGYWQATSASDWVNIGATESTMSEFYWRIRTRRLGSGDTSRECRCFCEAWDTGGDGTLRLRSYDTWDTAAVAAMTATPTYYQFGSTLNVACDLIDSIYPEIAPTGGGSTTVSLRYLGIIEEDA